MHLPPFRPLVAALAILIVGPVFGQIDGDAPEKDMDFDLPASDIPHMDHDSGLGLEDADFVGNPLKRFARNWPEDLVIAPIPGRSPQLGWKLTLAGGYFLGPKEEDSDKPPSILGGFGMVAENGSYAYGGGANLHLLDDKLRVVAGAAYVDIRYKFYGVGNTINDLDIGVDILQEAPMYFTSASWRIWNHLYMGIGYLGGSVDTRVRITLDPPPFADPNLKLDIGALNIPIQYDSRDHEQFPRSGWLIDGRAMLYRESFGGDFDTETFKLAVNHYRPMRERDAVAIRAIARSASNDAPFFLLSTVGGGTDLRGYPSGRFRDNVMYALQAEYRWQYNNRWIFTGFAGFGEVAESFGDIGENFLPAGGIGARFVLSQKHRVGLSADIAVGNDGAEFYFGVGEAF
jgi:hypothetical protein